MKQWRSVCVYAWLKLMCPRRCVESVLHHRTGHQLLKHTLNCRFLSISASIIDRGNVFLKKSSLDHSSKWWNHFLMEQIIFQFSPSRWNVHRVHLCVLHWLALQFEHFATSGLCRFKDKVHMPSQSLPLAANSVCPTCWGKPLPCSQFLNSS